MVKTHRHYYDFLLLELRCLGELVFVAGGRFDPVYVGLTYLEGN